MTKINNFDRQNLRDIRREMTIALAKVSEEYGVVFDIGNIRFDPASFRCKIEARVKGTQPSSVMNTIHGQAVSSNAFVMLGLDGNKRGPKGEKLVDYVPSRRKYPFTYETVRGTRYKQTADQAQCWFGK